MPTPANSRPARRAGCTLYEIDPRSGARGAGFYWRKRWGHRDATMVLEAYRHGLRVSELVDLRWDQVDFKTATLHVRRGG